MTPPRSVTATARTPAAAAMLALALVAAAPVAAFAPLGLLPLALATALLAGLLARPPLRPGPVALLLFAVAGAGLASALWSLDPGRSAAKGGQLLLLAGAAWLLATSAMTLPDAGRRGVLRAAAAGYALLAVLIAFEFATAGLIDRTIKAITDEPFIWSPVRQNRALTLLVLVTPVIAVCAAGRAIWAGAAVAAATIALVIAGQHHTSVVALAAGGAGAALAWLGRRGALLAGGAIAAAILLMPAVVAVALPAPALDQWMWTFSHSALHRLEIWAFAVDRIADRPWTGWGLEAARQVPGGDGLNRFGWQNLPLHTHNAALNVWLELGLLGAALFAGLQLALWRAAAGLARPARAAAGAMLGAAFAYQSLSYGVWQGWWLGALALAAMLVALLAEGEAAG